MSLAGHHGVDQVIDTVVEGVDSDLGRVAQATGQAKLDTSRPFWPQVGVAGNQRGAANKGGKLLDAVRRPKGSAPVGSQAPVTRAPEQADARIGGGAEITVVIMANAQQRREFRGDLPLILNQQVPAAAPNRLVIDVDVNVFPE